MKLNPKLFFIVVLLALSACSTTKDSYHYYQQYGITQLSDVTEYYSIAFFSHNIGEHYPHAFYAITGIDGVNKPIEAQYGFTPKSAYIAKLFNLPVDGKVHTDIPTEGYLEASNFHFSFKLSSDEYQKLLALNAEWQERSQPNYRLTERNCVHFIASVFEALGFSYNSNSKHWMSPEQFIEEVQRLNADLLLERGAVVYKSNN